MIAFLTVENQLVALPYNLLLSGVARRTLGIDVTNQIVVIDEAHSTFESPTLLAFLLFIDLVSTLLSLSSAVLDSSAVIVSASQLDAYLSRFRLRLSHDHLLQLRKLQVFLDTIQEFIAEWAGAKSARGGSSFRATEVMSTSEFVQRMGKNIEGVNFLDIRSYLEDSKVFRTLESQIFTDFFQDCQKDCQLFRCQSAPLFP